MFWISTRNLHHSISAPFSGGGKFPAIVTLYIALVPSKVQGVPRSKPAPHLQETGRLVQKSEEKELKIAQELKQFD